MKETDFIPQRGREGWAVDVSQEGNPEPQPAPQPLLVITGCLPAARSLRAEGPEEGGEWASGPSQHRPARPRAAGVGSELQPPTPNPAPTARDGPEKKPSSFNRAPSKPHNVQDRLDPGSAKSHSLDSHLKSLWSREGPRVPSGALTLHSEQEGLGVSTSTRPSEPRGQEWRKGEEGGWESTWSGGLSSLQGACPPAPPPPPSGSPARAGPLSWGRGGPGPSYGRPPDAFPSIFPSRYCMLIHM